MSPEHKGVQIVVITLQGKMFLIILFIILF